MPVFGLTGNLGCGKTTALMLFKEKGASIFDSDKKIHEYYQDKKSSIYKKISASFPQAIIHGEINRKALGGQVFSSREKLKQLEAIVHPAVIGDLKRWGKKVKQSGGLYVAEVPLLFEKNLEALFDGIILIYVKKAILLKRIKHNLQLSSSEYNMRLAAFKPVSEKIKKADFIINNSFGVETLKREIDILWGKLKQYS